MRHEQSKVGKDSCVLAGANYCQRLLEAGR